MRIGLCGAQRTGKTTLAREFAASVNLRFVATTTSSILESIDMDPKIHYPFAQRLDAQILILKKLKIQWDANINCVFDRTPLDVLAYLEADILRDFPDDPELIEKYSTYRKECVKALNSFDRIILIQPGIPIVEEAGKASGSLPYMEHFNSLLFGYMADFSMRGLLKGSILNRDVLDLNQRVEFLKKCLK
jgi:hypothetical protein